MPASGSARDVTVRLRADVASYIAQMRGAGAATRAAAQDADRYDASAGRMGNQIDKLSGRIRIATDAVSVFGPAAVPITSVAVPALAAMATQAGALATALGVGIVAFQGVGEAVKAVEKARLDPTVENLQAAQVAMAKIGPDAQTFVTRFQELRPLLQDVRDASAAGLFGGGLTDSLDDVEKLLPTLERIGFAYGDLLGGIAEDGIEALAGDDWAEFFDFIETDGVQSLGLLADATGNLGRFVAETLMAFDPASDNFAEGLVRRTDQLADAAARMDETQGFQDFLAYTREVGPQVLDTVGAIVNGLVQLGQAVAPLGGPALQILEGFADALAAIADSDLGTPIFAGLAALTLYNRGLQLGQAILKRSDADQKGYFAATVDGWRRQVASVRELPAAMRDVRTANATLLRDQSAYNKAAGTYNAQLKLRDAASGRSAAAQARLADSLGRVEVANAGVVASTDRVRAAEARRGAVIRDSAAGIGKSIGVATGLAVATSGLADGMGLSNTASLALMGTIAGPWGAAIGGGIGLVKDLAASGDGAADALTRLDNALDSGNADDLRAGLEAANRELDDLRNADSFGDAFMDGLRGFTTELAKGDFGFFDELEDKSFRAQEALDRLESRGVGSILTQGLGKDAREAAADLEFLTQGLLEYQAALDKLSGEYNLEQGLIATREAIRGITEAAEENPLGKNFADGLGEAGRQGDALREALLRAGQQAIDTAALMDDADSREYLQKTRRSIIETARALGLPMPKVRELLGSLGLLDKADAEPEVKVKGARKVVTDIDQVKRLFRALPDEAATEIVAKGIPTTVRGMRNLIRTYDLTPDEVRTLIGESGGAFTKRQIGSLIGLAKDYGRQAPKSRLSAQDNASGTIRRARGVAVEFDGTYTATLVTNRVTVFTTRGGNTGTQRPIADGGQVFARFPGETTGPRDDTIPAVLSHREFVQPVAAVDYYGERFMEDIRTRRLPRPAGYADGGSVRVNTAAGRAAYADGGPVRAAGGGLTIAFPAPAVTKAALIAAEGIAVASARTARTKREQLQADLEILQAQQRVRELERTLKSKKTKGAARELAQAELALARQSLTDLRNMQSEIDKLTEARTSAQSTLSGTLDIFARGASASGSVAATTRQIADLTTFGGLVAQLKSAGASPALLQQVIAKGQSGDLRSANRLAQSLLSQPALLGQLNAALGTFGDVTGNVAQLVTDPRLVGAGGAFGNVQQTVVQRTETVLQFNADPSSWMTQLMTQVNHAIDTKLAALGG